MSPYKRWATAYLFRHDDVDHPGDSDENLQNRLDALLGQPSIQSFLREYPNEAAPVESQLNALLRAHEQAANDASERQMEQSLLESFRMQSAERLPGRWTKNSRYRKYLEANYTEEEISLAPYDREASRLRKASSQEPPESSEELKLAIIQAWESALDAREQRRKLGKEKASEQKIIEEMEGRFSEFQKLFRLLGPIQDYLAFSWDFSSAELQESFFDIVKRSDEITEKQPEIEKLAAMLGRLQDAERDYVDRSINASRKPEARTLNRAAKSSLVGIRESDDISSMISAEAVLLASDQTEPLFYLKFAEKKLLTYDYQSEERSQGWRVPNKTVRAPVQRRGPVIIAVDTSASMQGEAEQNAKALALALSRIAFRQHRPVHLITFSGYAESLTLDPSERGPLDALIRFLLMSFHGGTDLRDPMQNALVMLKDDTFRRADIVFLTDGQASRFSSKQVAAMNDARAEGVRFYSLIIGSAPNKKLLPQFDHNWQYDHDNLTDMVINLERYRLNEF